jgi:hypothetical protein
MLQNDTEMPWGEPAAPFRDRLRRAAMGLTLALGIPLVLAWFGFVGWGVVWLAYSAL